MNRETRKHAQAAENLLNSELTCHRKNSETALCREIVVLGKSALKAITALKADLIFAEEKLEGIARVIAIGAEAAGVDTDPDPQACPSCLQMAIDYKGSPEAGWTFLCSSGHEWRDTRDVGVEPEPEPTPEPEPDPLPGPIVWRDCKSCNSMRTPHSISQVYPDRPDRTGAKMVGICPECSGGPRTGIRS